METDVIIIKGAPGSGKSETAKALSAYFPKGIRMEVDTVRSMVISVDWTNQQEHINMLQIAANMTLDYLNYNYKPVVVIDTFSGDKVKGFAEFLNNAKENISINIFALYTEENELKRRLEIRSDDMFKDFTVSKKLNNDIIKIKYEKEQIIDTTQKTTKETADNIYNILCCNT